jgi:hypothetical protein
LTHARIEYKYTIEQLVDAHMTAGAKEHVGDEVALARSLETVPHEIVAEHALRIRWRFVTHDYAE